MSYFLPAQVALPPSPSVATIAERRDLRVRVAPLTIADGALRAGILELQV